MGHVLSLRKYILVLILGFLFIPFLASAATTYTVTDLGKLPATILPDEGSSPGFPGNSINNAGEVVGYSNFLPFLYSGGQMINLETYSATPLPPVQRKGWAYGINDKGHVVGVRVVDAGPVFSAFLYDGQEMLNLGTLPGRQGSTAFSINEKDQIVGESDSSAFLYSNGQMVDLGTLPGHNYASAYSINEEGQVVGASSFFNPETYESSPTKGYLYQNGVMNELSPLPGDEGSFAYAINDAGQIVGNSYTIVDPILYTTNSTAVVWENGNLRDLGTLNGFSDSEAYAINNKGDIIGISSDDTLNTALPFIYTNGQMYDLLALIEPGPYSVNRAYAINDVGQIVASGHVNGENRALLLTPVPEPGAYALLLSGILMLVMRCKKQLLNSAKLQKFAELVRQLGRMQFAYSIRPAGVNPQHG